MPASTDDVSAAMYGTNNPITSGVMWPTPRPPAGGAPAPEDQPDDQPKES